MKFRNKETGKIRDFEFVVITKDMDAEFAQYAHHAPVLICRSIDQLNEEWEDYKHKEPLIKDERIRKIIRAWADENDSTRAVYYSPKNELVDSYGNIISFNLIFRKLNHGAEYTIDELCGEREAPEPLEPSFIDLDERIKEKAAAEKLYKGENDMHLTEEEE